MQLGLGRIVFDYVIRIAFFLPLRHLRRNSCTRLAPRQPVTLHYTGITCFNIRRHKNHAVASFMQPAFDKQRHIKHHSRTIRALFRRLRLFEQAFNHGRMNNIIQKLHTTLFLGCNSFR